MKTGIVMAMMTAWIGGALVGGAATNGQVRVSVDRANLRARPLADAEVVSQAEEGVVLAVVRDEGEWLQVAAPTNARVWVKAEFVKGGLVTSEQVNMRSGPGLSYRPVGALPKGERVTVLETRGEWLCLARPEGLALWISRKVVAPAEKALVAAPPAAAAIRSASAEEAPAIRTGSVFRRTLPAGLTVDHLAPVLGQGAVIERRGVLERVPLATLRGVEFRLTSAMDNKRTTVCYLRGNDAQLQALAGQQLTVTGAGYWLKGETVPLVYPDALRSDVPLR